MHRTQLATDADAVFDRLHRSQVQRNVKRAGRDGIVVRRAETQSDLTNSFYELQLQTRRRLGMPMQPRRFFEALWSHLLEPGHGSLLLAYFGTKPVAGAVFLTGSETMTYKYGASDASSWRLRPNHLLFWTAMRTACDAGYGWFDFGRSDLEDRGLREFKGGWGAVEEDLVYTKLPDPESESASAAARALPAMRAVIRRSPGWVSRLSGELLYRYAA
jgi:lipid II:glycine glycyltransferase (peptidoglycan interpeptide bridge formation enzyme)